MGSFTEVSLSFDFAGSTPAHVLAAFSKLAPVDQPNGALNPVPMLPEPVVEAWEDFVPDWREYLGPSADPFENEPWRHDWASWLSDTMGGSSTPHGLLLWSGRRWHLDCRCAWKTDPWTVSKALEWLAPFVEPRLGHYYVENPGPPAEFKTIPNPMLVGYSQYEGRPRPHLMWVTEGAWELEDLNPDNEFWG